VLKRRLEIAIVLSVAAHLLLLVALLRGASNPSSPTPVPASKPTWVDAEIWTPHAAASIAVLSRNPTAPTSPPSPIVPLTRREHRTNTFHRNGPTPTPTTNIAPPAPPTPTPTPTQAPEPTTPAAALASSETEVPSAGQDPTPAHEDVTHSSDGAVSAHAETDGHAPQANASASANAGAGSSSLAQNGGVDPYELIQSRLAKAALRCYPRAATRLGLTGTTQVRFCVDGQGQPERVEITNGSGEALLDRAATECVVGAAAPFPPLEKCLVVPVRFAVP
jgi:TonB family protein